MAKKTTTEKSKTVAEKPAAIRAVKAPKSKVVQPKVEKKRRRYVDPTLTSEQRGNPKLFIRYQRKDARRNILRAVYGPQSNKTCKVEWENGNATPADLARARQLVSDTFELTGWPMSRLKEILRDLNKMLDVANKKQASGLVEAEEMEMADA
jgi:hypothetical protein